MNNITGNDMEETMKVITQLISRCENVIEKFKHGSSQYTLQKNRIEALHTALALVESQTGKNTESGYLSKYYIEKAVKPIASLISKSEKAKSKLAKCSWQYKFLENNLKSLNTAELLISKALNEIDME